MNTVLIVLGAVVIFCGGILIGISFGKMDGIIINMKR